LPAGTKLRAKGRDFPWVSRGGVKLDHALEYFGVDVSGLTVLDVGASTGGFTDVVLSRGAAKVYAVDVGHGQLAWSLRSDARVVVLERCNARYLSKKIVPDPIDLVLCDVSFIGLETVLPASLSLVKAGGALIALIKPQFEVGKGAVGKGGVVRDSHLHERVCERIETWIENHAGWQSLGIVPSPITGPAGNVEFLIGAKRDADG
jgi:23S rRNA (cytidine1920-2'-O)/16S rRNA (cytidine1409-2'-O)-methyltransferase